MAKAPRGLGPGNAVMPPDGRADPNPEGVREGTGATPGSTEAEVKAMERSKRRSRPTMEGLEGRRLLSTIHRRNPNLPTTEFTPAEVRYTTPQGSAVDIKISGPGAQGSLKGTTVDSGGNLNLVFSGTSVFTTIVATVQGGTGQANLASIHEADVPLDSLSGLGGDLVGRVLLPSFNLIPGGQVNLTSGVQVFNINSAAANSQVHLRDTPLNTTLGIPSYVNTITGGGLSYARISAGSTGATSSTASGLSSGTSIGVATGSSAGSGFTVNNPGTLNPVAVGFGGGSVAAINGAIPIINTIGNGENFLGTPGLTQSQVNQGRTLTYVTDSAGGTQLSAIAGTFMPGANLIVPHDFSLPPTPVPPPGVIVTINHVNGGSTAKTPPLGDAQIYGYDATANALIRFDIATGAALQSIPLPASTAGVGGISLARLGAEQVVLVGIGPNVLAFDAETGASAGQFSTGSLAGIGLTAVTGVGTTGDATVLVDSRDGTDGTAQSINLAQSLATGQAVAVGLPYSPAREFGLAGPLTGVPGTGNLYALGAAFLDTTQPNAKQVGVLTITPAAGGNLAESSRTALTSQGLDIPAGPNNGIAGNPSVAIGSLNSFLAIDTGVVNGQNVVKLYSPIGLTAEGSFTLDDANPLADLSQSFHPELANTTLIDVQGNVQSFTAKTATGLVLNDAGNLNLLTIGNASNSSVIGLPFGHVDIAVRNNVTITTNSRLVGKRGGVTINPSAQQVGPLVLP